MATTVLATFLLASSSPGGESPSAWMQLFPFVLMALIFYFLLFAPERRRRKQTQEMLSALSNGDKIVTTGGLHGKVVGVTDQIIQVRIADGVKVEISRTAVASKLND
jgi:preprotein translocase subunit YajC